MSVFFGPQDNAMQNYLVSSLDKLISYVILIAHNKNCIARYVIPVMQERRQYWLLTFEWYYIIRMDLLVCNTNN